jgi:serpin B
LNFFIIHKRVAYKAVLWTLLSPGLVCAASAEVDKLVAANSIFALNLMQVAAQSQPGENIFISPYSVSSALQTWSAGAAGETKAELQHTLGTESMSDEELNTAIQALDTQLTGREGMVLDLADSFWYRSRLQLRPAFIESIHQRAKVELMRADFDQQAGAKLINDWVFQKARGNITGQYKPSPVDFRVINVAYFKGKWQSPFEKQATLPRDFHLGYWRSKQVPMMFQGEQFDYQQTTEFQAVKLPYIGGLEMELYLPQKNSNPQKLIANIARGQNWRKSVQMGFVRQKVLVYVPKFTIEYQADLSNGLLQKLGINMALDIGANYSLITSNTYAIEVKQMARIVVDEDGTEAFAVTTVNPIHALDDTPPPVPVIILDRPFFFVISDKQTGNILFMGIVSDPR